MGRAHRECAIFRKQQYGKHLSVMVVKVSQEHISRKLLLTPSLTQEAADLWPEKNNASLWRRTNSFFKMRMTQLKWHLRSLGG